MKKALYASLVLTTLLPFVSAQSAKAPPDFTGTWGTFRAGRGGGDAKLNPPPAGELVLKPEYAKPYEARRAAEAEANKRGEQLATGGSQCIPYGVPTMMSVAVYPVEIIQTAKQMTIISEAFSEVRRVYLDRPQAPIDDVAPGYYGRSVGKWDGDTLVVDTIGIKTSVNGYRGMPHSDKMRITEHPEQAILLHHLNLVLPQQPPPRITTSASSAPPLPLPRPRNAPILFGQA